jgi:hypothetical protein
MLTRGGDGEAEAAVVETASADLAAVASYHR